MSRYRFDLAELQAVVAVADRSSFRAAAEQLHLSPSALSRRVERLEAILGIKLFERDTRNVSLTHGGRTFLQRARAALEELDSAVLAISDQSAQRSGIVSIACIPAAGYHYLPAAIAAFSSQYPRVRIRIIDESANAVLNAVLAGRADFGINFIGTQEADLDFEPIFTESFVLAVHADHRLAERESVRWEELADERFMAADRSSANRILIDVALAECQRRPAALIEATHLQMLLGLINAGLGVAAIPRLALQASGFPNLRGVPLVEPAVSRTLGLIKRRGRPMAGTARLFCDMLRDIGQGLTPV